MTELLSRLIYLVKRCQRRYLIKRLCLIAILTFLIYKFNSSETETSYQQCSSSNVKKLYAKSNILKGNIEYILKNNDDLFNTPYADVMSKSDRNEIFNKYNQAASKISPFNKVYLDENRQNANKNKTDFYLILEYTKIGNAHKYCEQKLDDYQRGFFNDENNYLSEAKVSNKTYALLDNCSYKNCFFTCDKKLATKADALLFHLTDLDLLISQAPTSSYTDVYNSIFDFPRQKSQSWILWNDEANYVSSHFDDFRMNWTISYLFESEASYGAYGTFQRSKENWTISRVKREFKERKSTSIWFVSNCNSKYRNRLVPELSKFTDVQIYGQCESVLREQNPDINLDGVLKSEECKRESDCEKNLLHGNKFFLAFENSNCSNYITEKFWRSLSFDIIPVVVMPPKVFYDRMAPANSFIHAEDFDFDVEQLGNYLKRVSEDFGLYAKYFEWKQFYASQFYGNQLESLRMCELCFRMNTEKHHVYYESVSEFFNEKCQV